jgi:hypothetical protein
MMVDLQEYSFQSYRMDISKLRIDIFYHRFGNGIPGNTTKAPPHVIYISMVQDLPSLQSEELYL